MNAVTIRTIAQLVDESREATLGEKPENPFAELVSSTGLMHSSFAELPDALGVFIMQELRETMLGYPEEDASTELHAGRIQTGIDAMNAVIAEIQDVVERLEALKKEQN